MNVLVTDEDVAAALLKRAAERSLTRRSGAGTDAISSNTPIRRNFS